MYGPFNTALRIEAQIAKVAAPMFRNASQKDLMSWPDKSKQSVSLEEAMREWR